MKIIKKGNIEQLNRIKRFKCTDCGCIFEADNTEYIGYIGDSQHNEMYYYCECPCCKKDNTNEVILRD